MLALCRMLSLSQIHIVTIISITITVMTVCCHSDSGAHVYGSVKCVGAILAMYVMDTCETHTLLWRHVTLCSASQ